MANQLQAQAFYAILKIANIDRPVTEFIFHPTRKWRMDYAWPYYKVAVEVEGGVFSGGRHTRGVGFMGDMEKYNTATSMGWKILRVTPSTLLKIETVQLIKTTIKNN